MKQVEKFKTSVVARKFVSVITSIIEYCIDNCINNIYAADYHKRCAIARENTNNLHEEKEEDMSQEGEINERENEKP
jgi:hypothetical protein